MTDLPPFARQLQERLQQVLPGPAAQLLLAPGGRDLPSDPLDHLAAVLVALVYHQGEWHFPLIRRVEDGYVHGGQVGFPGGRKEGDESPEETALREAWEEVRMPSDRVHLLGRLSPLPIPVSRTRVMPVVGMVDHLPDLIPDPCEVQSIFFVPVEELTAEDIVTREIWNLRGNEYDIPFFTFNGHKVWGATAMILSELRAVLKS